MISLPSAVRVFLYTAPADMRRSFDGLALLARQFMGQDPLSGHLFVFGNKRADRIKVLYWDKDGYALWYKRLERGVFVFPSSAAASVEVQLSELMLLLEGIEISSIKRRPRYVLHHG